MAATVPSAWRRPARIVVGCPRSESLPAARGQPGSCRETAMCRRADRAGVSATPHIGRGVLFRSSPKAHHRTGQVPWGSAVPYPGCLGGERANPGSGRGAPRRGRCLPHQARQHQSSRRCRVDRSAPDGPHLEDAALSCREPCQVRRTLLPKPSAKRRQHLSKAPERVRHVTAPSSGGTCGNRRCARVEAFEESVPFTGCFPPHPHPAGRSNIRPNSPGMG
jgi:hypothetical protein